MVVLCVTGRCWSWFFVCQVVVDRGPFRARSLLIVVLSVSGRC